MSLLKLQEAGRVKRWHTMSIIGQQTVAEHSYGVVNIINKLWPDATKELILAALYHDAAEVDLGDIPHPSKNILKKVAGEFMLCAEVKFHIKNRIPHSVNISFRDQARLKLADTIEAALFCKHQMEMGNNRGRIPGCYKGILEEIKKMIEVADIRKDLDQESKMWINQQFNV